MSETEGDIDQPGLPEIMTGLEAGDPQLVAVVHPDQEVLVVVNKHAWTLIDVCTYYICIYLRKR